MLSALERFGGVLLRPRATVAGLAPAAGARDGLWLTLAYLFAAELRPLAGGLASLAALQNLSGLMALGSTLGRALLPPIIVLVLCELVLGHARSYRRGLCLVPLVAVAALATGLALLGVRLPGPSYVDAVVGGVASLALAHRIRPVVVVEDADDVAAVPASRGARVAGAALLLIILVVGGAAGARVAARWDRLGPLAPGSATPKFAVRMLEGDPLTPAAFADRVGVLVFWATWCGVCKSQMPMYQELHDELAGREVEVVAVNHEGSGVSPRNAATLVSRYVGAEGYTFPFAIDDGSMNRDFRVSMIPHTVIIGREGRVRYVHQGRVTKSTLVDEVHGLLRE